MKKVDPSSPKFYKLAHWRLRAENSRFWQCVSELLITCVDNNSKSFWQFYPPSLRTHSQWILRNGFLFWLVLLGFPHWHNHLWASQRTVPKGENIQWAALSMIEGHWKATGTQVITGYNQGLEYSTSGTTTPPSLKHSVATLFDHKRFLLGRSSACDIFICPAVEHWFIGTC